MNNASFSGVSLRQIVLTLTAAPFLLAAPPLPAQQLDNATVVQHIDAAVQARLDHIAEYSVTEHYAVFRGGDETHPAAEMTVKTVYRKEQGKSYTTLSESGSSFLRSQVLATLLEKEKQINLPGNRDAALIKSANYEMKLVSGQPQPLAGRDCLVLSITPRRESPALFNGTLWVDAKDFTIVQLEGQAAKSYSVFTGPAQVARQYALIDGFSMATHARAASNSALFGQTVIKIDYQGYEIKLAPAG